MVRLSVLGRDVEAEGAVVDAVGEAVAFVDYCGDDGGGGRGEGQSGEKAEKVREEGKVKKTHPRNNPSLKSTRSTTD